MTFKSHLSQCHPALDSPDFSIRDRKSRIRLFSEKIVEMISKFDQGYCDGAIQYAAYHFLISNSGLASTARVVYQIIDVEYWRAVEIRVRVTENDTIR